jgi:hypothetical protein
MLFIFMQHHKRSVDSCPDVTTTLWLLFFRLFQQRNITIFAGLPYFVHIRFQNFPSSQRFLRDRLLVERKMR